MHTPAPSIPASKFFAVVPAVLGLLLSGPLASGAVVLFQDSFETYTSGAAFPSTPTAPWTDNDPTNDSTRLAISSAKASDGSQSVFLRDGARSITTTSIDVTGFTTLFLEIHVAQNAATSYETGDFFRIRANVDEGGFAQLLTNTARLTSGGSEGAPLVYTGSPLSIAGSEGSASGAFSAYYLQMDVTGASTLRLEFSMNSGTNGETYWFDQVVVSAVPESGPAMLLALGGLAVMLRRRRA